LGEIYGQVTEETKLESLPGLAWSTIETRFIICRFRDLKVLLITHDWSVSSALYIHSSSCPRLHAYRSIAKFGGSGPQCRSTSLARAEGWDIHTPA